MAEATMTETQFDELVSEVGAYLQAQSIAELNRKAWFLVGVCAAGGFYTGVRAHIWWTRQKQIAETLKKQSQ